MKQTTIDKEIKIEGIGLHSGKPAILKLKPARANTGIIFKRIDLENSSEIKAISASVIDTKLSTNIGTSPENRASTIEHLMATFHSFGIDNVFIETNNVETPIMDGSALNFVNTLKDCKIIELDAPKYAIKILKEVTFTDDKGSYTSIKPNDNGLEIDFTIELEKFTPSIMNEKIKLTKEIFIEKIAPARTFGFKEQLEYLRSIGLIQGGSLDNAIVLDGNNIINENGLRIKNELVCHKILDSIGDLYLLGHQVIGHFTGYKSGHYHTVELTKKILADKSNYEIIEI